MYCDTRRPGAEATSPVVAGALSLRGQGLVIGLDGNGPWTVGREGVGGEHLQSYDTISRRHARIERADGALSVRDLRSANGTFVDGARVPEERTVPLRAGAQLGLGRSVELTVEVGDR
jgi:pSer/pThr/pTyr-binding forkhead associated (FHA) protein